MHLALDEGRWPVLDEPWVYPAGALVPLLLPALATTISTTGYALGWCVGVTALDAVAFGALLRRERGITAAMWWMAFLVLLGPVAIGRLDAVIVPLMLLALLVTNPGGPRRTRLAAVLLTLGAWVKVAPGALLIPLAAAARRPVRDVVGPAALVCAVVVAAVAAGGGLPRVAGFLTTQTGRGLQVESIAATPWVLAALVRDDVAIAHDAELITYEVTGPGTVAAATVLDVALVLAVLAVAAVLLVARHRAAWSDALLPPTALPASALLLLTVLIVTNKVGSPQFLTWLAAPVTVLLATGPVGRWVAGLTLGAAALTQVVFPWCYPALLTGLAGVTAALALRNVTLLALLACAVVGLIRVLRPVSAAAGRPRGR